MTLRLSVLLIVTLIAGCDFQTLGPGLSDFDYPVAGSYELWRTSAHQISVIPSSGWTKDMPMIPAKVVEVAWDDRFVLGKQQHLKRRSPDNPNDTYEEPGPGKYSYWILDTSVPTSYGPFALDKFDHTRQELGISDELTLRDVYEFKR